MPLLLHDTTMSYVLVKYGPPALKFLVSAMCVVLVLVDVTTNNWELNHTIGNANSMLNAVLNIASPAELTETFTFARGYSLDTTSNVGLYMLNFTLNKIHAHDNSMYVLTAESFLIDSPVDDICHLLKQSYPLPNYTDVGSTIKLGVIKDGVQYVRGYVVSNVIFGLGAPPPPESKHEDLVSLGYTPSRTDTDMRLTTPVTIPPPGTVVSTNVSMFQYFARAYCSGCDPIAVLGLDVCSVVTSYNASTRTLVVESSAAVLGNSHVLGLLIERSGVTMGSLYVRGFAVLFVTAVFATSQKTVRWTDGSTLTTWVKKLGHMLAPTLLRYPCRTFDFSYFCFNSDFFVVGYVVAVLLDEKTCNVYSRAMHSWNKNTAPSADSTWVFIRILAMNFRWMWLNCFFVKAIKWVVNFTNSTRYTGRNRLVAYLNFSSPGFVYIAGLILALRNHILDYGLADVAQVTSTQQNLDGIAVNMFNSTLMRGYPSLMMIMFVNLFIILTLDWVVNHTWWRHVSKNSLGRQLMYNSTSVIADVGFRFVNVPDYKGQVASMSARSLCTIQWFLTSQTIRFGLPEHPTVIRAMASKGLASAGQSQLNASGPTKRASIYQSDLEAGETNALLMVAQDQDGHIHLFNAMKSEMQALSLEVKVLADAKFQLA
ncbi:hypothetical protein B5M09_003174 [Aphanomyces astaci]|uniref:Uncharacterized protein n=1 Tax=Aphanomyces astaci TaxID=112090 RepID=A0A3R7Y6V2_APHAT|nr:hypothetical protein B5M09_003174 [Aphanomyces astaci]